MKEDKSKIKKFLIIGALLFSVFACKDERNDIFPNKSFQIILSPTEVMSLVPGSIITKEGSEAGVSGLIIYRVSEVEFYAFDKLCTNYPADTAAVIVDKSTQIATCPKCKSTFTIPSFGQPSKGPAKYGLKQYQTSLKTDGRLHIWN